MAAFRYSTGLYIALSANSLARIEASEPLAGEGLPTSSGRFESACTAKLSNAPTNGAAHFENGLMLYVLVFLLL